MSFEEKVDAMPPARWLTLPEPMRKESIERMHTLALEEERERQFESMFAGMACIVHGPPYPTA